MTDIWEFIPSYFQPILSKLGSTPQQVFPQLVIFPLPTVILVLLPLSSLLPTLVAFEFRLE